MALYMAVRASPAVQATLIASGCDPAMQVTIVTPTTLADMAERALETDGPAIILLRVPAAERPARLGGHYCTGVLAGAPSGPQAVREEPGGEVRRT